MRRWGATDSERDMTPPGDEIVPAWGVRQPRVAGIDAPGRGCLAGIAPLESLAGCRMRDADRVHPEQQQR